MTDYDIILIHPPAIFDFRKKPLFPGPLGSTVERIQFVKVPIGMISIANYLDSFGYKVIIDNLADRMTADAEFDVKKHLKNLSAKIFGIDLHWHHHAQGAIEVARLCKELHPDSLIILGGLTATYFHQEIIAKYNFVDAVIRGEAEKPLLHFIKDLKRNNRIGNTPNLTYRLQSGEIKVTPLMETSCDLDEFNFTRFDLLEPKTSIFTEDKEPHGSLVVCRGCIYNCTTCGASSYSYKKYMGMLRPSFRSPVKIADDIRQLRQQGIKFIGLYQDPRMGGESYWRELMAILHREIPEDVQLSIDLLAPAGESFIKEVAAIGRKVLLYICPDSGSCSVRKRQGRNYTTEELLDTVKLCHKYHIPVTVFFSVGLAGEDSTTIKKTWELWDELCMLDHVAIQKKSFKYIEHYVPTPIVGPIIIDPGSLAFDQPEKHGYKLLFRDLEEYINALSKPSWHQWLNHETDLLDKKGLIELIFESLHYSINESEKYRIYYHDSLAIADRIQTKLERIAADEVDNIMDIADETERNARLSSLITAIESLMQSSEECFDEYGYYKNIRQKLAFG